MTVRLLTHRFTVEEYQEMGRAGILTKDDRVELIEGEIVQMSPIGSRHAACVNRLTRLLVGERAIVAVQNPVRIAAHSEPQPDLALLRPRQDFYDTAHPAAADVLLVIEVIQSSEDYDREFKLPLYARAGIPELWLVDLQRGRIEVHQRPSGAKYRKATLLGAGDEISPHAFPQVSLKVKQILGL